MKKLKNNIRGILIIFLLLLIAILGISFYNYVEKSEYERDKSENLRIIKLEEENNLRSELDEIIEQYENMRSEMDRLNVDMFDKESEIDDLKKEIRELLNTKDDLKLAREKIRNLQEISKRYFAQVDSLLGETVKQKEVIDSLTSENKSITNKNKDLNKENIDLNERLDLGSSLNVYDVEIFKIKFGTHGQEKSVKRAKNIQVLRTCFKISANAIAKNEVKKVYVQYFSPSGELLSSASTPSESYFLIGDTNLVNTTTFSEFNYNNDEVDMCIDWQRGDILEKGEYKMRFYIDGRLSGKFKFNLN